jgi:hypothetical protein
MMQCTTCSELKQGISSSLESGEGDRRREGDRRKRKRKKERSRMEGCAECIGVAGRGISLKAC